MRVEAKGGAIDPGQVFFFWYLYGATRFLRRASGYYKPGPNPQTTAQERKPHAAVVIMASVHVVEVQR